MPRIMCNQTLWRALGGAEPLRQRPFEGRVTGVVLGNWAAKAFRDNARDLVVAVEERTYLTLVYPVGPRASFRAQLADALEMILRDLQVAEDHVVAERNAVDFWPLVRLADRSLAAKLADLQFFCEIELGYHADLRQVQLNLNEVPHGDRVPGVAREAVVKLFAAAGRRGSSIH
jgi:hypothetical protein